MVRRVSAVAPEWYIPEVCLTPVRASSCKPGVEPPPSVVPCAGLFVTGCAESRQPELARAVGAWEDSLVDAGYARVPKREQNPKLPEGAPREDAGPFGSGPHGFEQA